MADLHKSNWPFQNKSFDGLRRNFNTLWKQGPPTGDPNCPPRFLRAKRIHFKISEKAGIGVDVEDDLDLPDVFADTPSGYEPLSQVATQATFPDTPAQSTEDEAQQQLNEANSDNENTRRGTTGIDRGSLSRGLIEILPRPFYRRRRRDTRFVVELMQMQLAIDAQHIEEKREERVERMSL